MLDQLDALIALQQEGTTSAAAAALRVSQSTISKRIATLEARVGRVLHEPHGRGCRLTQAGEAFVDRIAPLVAELRTAVQADADGPVGRISIACSESIFASWGADVLAAAQRRLDAVAFEFHAHRSPVAIERVRSGRCHVALVAGGRSSRDSDLVERVLGLEEMVVVPSGLARKGLASRKEIDVWTIEESSVTWAAIRNRVEAMGRAQGPRLLIAGRLESFTSLVRLAMAGFGHALVPAGVARSLGVRSRSLLRLRTRGADRKPLLRRKISWVGRRATLRRPHIAALEVAVEREIRTLSL